MATQPSEVDTTVNDGSSIKRGKRRRSVTEINNGWDETKKVADVLRGGQRAKGNDGKSEMQREDPGLLELFAMYDVADARHTMVIAELLRQREKLKQLGFARVLD